MKTVMYEFETQRTNVSPREFWRWTCNEFKKRTGRDFEWIDNFEDWEAPIYPGTIRVTHNDWDPPLREICKVQELDFQYYLQASYNFIMEWFDGTGYCYAIEYER